MAITPAYKIESRRQPGESHMAWLQRTAIRWQRKLDAKAGLTKVRKMVESDGNEDKSLTDVISGEDIYGRD